MNSCFALLVVLAASPCLCQQNDPPVAEGYVTRATSPTDLDVNGMHLLFDSKTEIERLSGHQSDTGLDPTMPYIGQPVEVYGARRNKIHSIAATRVIFRPHEPHDVSGSGIVDAVLSAAAAPAAGGDHLLRADGYPVQITARTAVTFTPPLNAVSAYRANVWMSFHGRQRPDGVVVADAVTLTANNISGREDKLRTRGEYDPAAVDPSARQGAWSKGFRGIDPKQIPPYHDDAMQARVSDIGGKLVPSYQRDLSDQDATKIHFRFQVVDQKQWREAMTLPSGIIIVPRQVVERLQNDAQLAAVLADNIAGALEKDDLHLQSASTKLAAAQVAEAVGSIFVPGLGLAALAANAGTSSAIMSHVQQKCSRVSLSLLHDAGYDVEQAPIAWWLLASKKPKAVADILMPRRTAYLYKTLGETWRSH